MTPILLTKSDKKIAFLKDATKCEVTEERNGIYELELEYPVAGQYFLDIALDCRIKAKPNSTSEPQIFRIYSISKPILGTITINAEHISYALSHYPIQEIDTTKTTALVAIDRVLSAANEFLNSKHKFTADYCDISSVLDFGIANVSARAALGGVEGSVLDRYGGEYEFDNYKIKLHKSRGRDNGVKIKFGRNMTEMKLTVSTENSYTGIFPFAKEDDAYITLSEGVIHVDNNSGIEERILSMDFSDYFDGEMEKNESNLRSCVAEYLTNNDINAVDATMTVSMIDLSRSAHADYVASLEMLSLCDTVKVVHTIMNVSVKLKIIKTVYDSIGEKYISLELGSARSDFSDVIKQLQKSTDKALKKVSEIPDTSALEQKFQNELTEATQKITGASGGHVVLNPSQNPQEILVLCDSDKLMTAKKLYRWNSAGLAFSSNGYNGPYNSAFLGDDGKLIINNVTARNISANLIKAGMLSSSDGSTYFNLDSNQLVVANYRNGSTPAEGAYEIDLRSGKIDFKGATSGGQLGKTAAIRTGYTVENGKYTAKHFAIGYISNTTGSGYDGSDSIKIGAFDSITDQFSTILQIDASKGAIFSADVSGKVNVYNKLGHYESNTEHNEHSEYVSANEFSYGFKHYSCSKQESTYAWRQHYYGSYVDSLYRHWTGWQAYNSSGKFMHSLTSMQADYSSDTTVLRLACPDTARYISVGTNAVYFQKDYGVYNSNRQMLSLYCDNVYLSNGTSSGTNVKERLNDLYNSKANTSITGTSLVNSETHYTTLKRHENNLNELYKVTGSTAINSETHSTQLDGLKYVTTKLEGSTYYLLFRTYGEAAHGNIGCSSAHNFGFYSGGDHSSYANIYAANINSASSKEFKNNIKIADIDAMSIVEKSQIYSFNYNKYSYDNFLTTESYNSEKRSFGFITEYETPDEVVAEDGKAVNLYSMISIAWKAIQELAAQIHFLENKFAKEG